MAVTGPLRPCDNPRCQLCHPRSTPPADDMTLAEMFVAAAALGMIFFAAFLWLGFAR